MNDSARYLNDFFTVMGKIEVTDDKNNQIIFNDGIERAIEIIKTQTGAGRKIIFIGNGGSAGIASHCAIDYWKNGRMRAVSFNDGALLTCIGNDFGYSSVFEKPIEMFAESGDILIAISSSGQSENILRGAKASRSSGCKIISLSGFSSINPLRALGDLNFYVPSSHYGYLEIGHQTIIHMILDIINERNTMIDTKEVVPC